MELTILEKALLEDNHFFKSIFKSTFFSVKVLGKQNLDQISATSIIFLALRKNVDNHFLKSYVEELRDRMVSNNNLALFDVAHRYCLTPFLQKAFTNEEFFELCCHKVIKIEIPILTERIYGVNAKSFQRTRALNTLLLELAELKEVSLYNLKWCVNKIAKFTNRDFYQSVEIWIEEK